MIPILILAAGRSSRMRGRDKLLEDLGGESLIRRQARHALALGGRVFVAVGPDQDEREEALAGLDVHILQVPDAVEGMSGTLRGAVAQLPPWTAFMLVLGDLVALEPEDLAQVCAAHVGQPDHLIWRGATEDGKAGHPIIFADALRSAFAELSGDGGAQVIVAGHQDRTCLVALPGTRARLDLDTPEDWDEWRAVKG
ncbi:nucleotidyltransferase family protein [Yoonia sp.]|uniref:nucleotidyltransferase family protein n=1 Tax=Yoonia sp. TaxID=2212373 RepID=UPI002FD99E56